MQIEVVHSSYVFGTECEECKESFSNDDAVKIGFSYFHLRCAKRFARRIKNLVWEYQNR